MTKLTATFTFAMFLVAHGLAAAQAAPTPAAPQPAPAAAPAPAPAAPAPLPAAEPAPAEAPSPAPAAEPAPAEAEAEPAHDAGKAPEHGGAWSDDLAISMFVDTYYNFDFNLPDVMNANYRGHNPYVQNNGFGLAFLGIDPHYQVGKVGAHASLRFGPGATPLIGQTGGGLGLDNIWQAYLSYDATEKLTLDAGQFATLYGAEVGESWLNINYTRGALYFNYQPFWHTGLKLKYAATDEIAVNALIVNGVNQPLDADRGPDLGVQVALTPSEQFFVALGWYGSTQPDNKPWANFVDLVANAYLGDATLILNVDVGVADAGSASHTYYGASLAAKYAFSEEFAAGLRGEYLADPDLAVNSFGKSLITATATLECIPLDSKNIIVRLDGRLDKADADIYFGKDTTLGDDDADPTTPPVPVPSKDMDASIVLGLVVKTS